MRNARGSLWLGWLFIALFALGQPVQADKGGAVVHRQLPAVATRADIAKARAASPQIEAQRQRLLAKIDRGELGKASPRAQALEAKTARLAGRVHAALKASTDDRPILVILEGPDGAGKSSTIRRLRGAFEGARPLEVAHFGAPPKEYAGFHWSKRFVEKLPAKGTVAIWDRSYYGGVVYDPYYGMLDKAGTKQRLQEVRDFESMLADGFVIVKLFLDASTERQAKTIAKREVLAHDKLSSSDYLTFQDRKQIRGLFKQAVKATDGPVPWHKVSMDDRGAARVKVMRVLARALAPK